MEQFTGSCNSPGNSPGAVAHVLRFFGMYPAMGVALYRRGGVEFYLYPTVSTALVHSVKPELTE